MFLLLTSSLTGAASTVPVMELEAPGRVSRLNPQTDRRRMESVSGEVYGLGPKAVCDKIDDWTWDADSWADSAGTLKFKPTEIAQDFRYIFEEKSTITGGSKDLNSINFYEGEEGDEGPTKHEKDGKSWWMVDPRDAWFDNAPLDHELTHWIMMEPTCGDKVVEPKKDLELYFCYSPLLLELYWNPETDLAGTVMNLVGFLAQAGVESADFKACDENNHTGWTAANPSPFTNKPAECSQRDQPNDTNLENPQPADYFYSSLNKGAYTCEVTSSLHMTAQTHTLASDALECKPGTETEGCCWWGRGSIQITGPANYGAFQNHVIKRNPAYDGLNLCENPEALCEDTYPTLKWVSGLFYWIDSVQKMSCFHQSLAAYVAEYNLEATSGTCNNFVDGTGSAVNNGDWAGHAHNNEGRRTHFKNLADKVSAYITSDSADADAPYCTGNTAVDEVLHGADVAITAKISAEGSAYSWDAFCKAIRDFKQ